MEGEKEKIKRGEESRGEERRGEERRGEERSGGGKECGVFGWRDKYLSICSNQFFYGSVDRFDFCPSYFAIRMAQ